MTKAITSRLKENTLIDGVLIKGDKVLNYISDSEWERVYNKYKGYFDKRIQTEKNPSGIFIVSSNSQKAEDQTKEAGSEILDIDKKIDEIVDKTLNEEAPQLSEAHKRNKEKTTKGK